MTTTEPTGDEPLLESAMGGADTGAGPAGFSDAEPLEPDEARQALKTLGAAGGDGSSSESESTPT